MSAAARPPQPRNHPTRDDLEAARDKTVDDVIAPRLLVLFCGINPSLYSAAVGHHFARPGNRFWRALHGAGFTHRLLDPSEDQALLEARLGVTNLVARATAAADELRPDEIRLGAEQLRRRVARFQPAVLAVLGVGAYRRAFAASAAIGRQELTIGVTGLWVLPNPSGLQARYQLPELIELFSARLRRAVTPPGP